MKNLVGTVLVGALLVAASSATAGGPVILEEGNPEVIEEAPGSKLGILPLLLIPLFICAVACGGSDPVDRKKK